MKVMEKLRFEILVTVTGHGCQSHSPQKDHGPWASLASISLADKKPALHRRRPDGERSVILNTIVGTRWRRGLDPYANLREVLMRLPRITNRQFKDVTPEARAKARAARTLAGASQVPEHHCSHTVDASSRIDLAGKGFVGGSGSPGNGTGPGAGNAGDNGGGAGHGGIGGDGRLGGIGGGVYGSVTNPLTFGSGGGRGYLLSDLGGNGGGAARLRAAQLRVDGEISANGVGNTGGGSGGSLNLTIGTKGVQMHRLQSGIE